MKIKLIALAALVLGGNVAFSMDQKYFNIVTPQIYFHEIKHKQEKEILKNTTHLNAINFEAQQRVEKANRIFLPEFNPSSPDDTCSICLDKQQDETTKLPWTKVLTCNHYFHIKCIGQFGTEAEESIAQKCPNCQQKYTLSINVKPFLSKDTKITLLKRNLVPYSNEDQSTIFWNGINKKIKKIITEVKDTKNIASFILGALMTMGLEIGYQICARNMTTSNAALHSKRCGATLTVTIPLVLTIARLYAPYDLFKILSVAYSPMITYVLLRHSGYQATLDTIKTLPYYYRNPREFLS